MRTSYYTRQVLDLNKLVLSPSKSPRIEDGNSFLYAIIDQLFFQKSKNDSFPSNMLLKDKARKLRALIVNDLDYHIKERSLKWKHNSILTTDGWKDKMKRQIFKICFSWYIMFKVYELTIFNNDIFCSYL